MSSRPAAPTSRLPLLLLVVLLGCQGRTPGERTAPALASAPAAIPSASPPAPVPWFQGQWQDGASENGGASVRLVVDAAGQVVGTANLNMALTGLVDQETIRVEAQGEGGHGVAVLHHQAGALHGVLHYAPHGAAEGAKIPLTLTRGKPP